MSIEYKATPTSYIGNLGSNFTGGMKLHKRSFQDKIGKYMRLKPRLFERDFVFFSLFRKSYDSGGKEVTLGLNCKTVA